MPDAQTYSFYKRCASLGVLVSAAVLYLLNLSSTYVGFYYDDSDYILAGLALSHGHYRLMRLPWHPLINYRWPGFPLVLTPFVALVEPYWEYLKVVPFAFTVLSGFLVWKWTRRRLALWPALAVTALFAWNPLTLDRSQAIMAEPLLLALVLGIFLLMDTEPARALDAWMIGCLGAFSILVRPEGMILVIAVTAAFVLTGEFRRAWRAAAPSVLLFILYRGIRALGHAPAPAYWAEWQTNLAYLDLHKIFRHVGMQMVTLVAGSVFNLPLPKTAASFWTGVAVTIVGGALFLAGALRVWKSTRFRAAVVALFLFCIGNLLFHSLWFSIDRRYLWPLVPVLFYFAAALFSERKSSAWKIAGACGFVLLAGNFLLADWGQIRAARHPSAELRRPEESLVWMRDHLSRKDLVLTNNPSMVYLYTGKWAVGLQHEMFKDAGAFLNGCLDEGVTVICYTAPPVARWNLPATEDVTERWKASQQWVVTRSFAFEPIYHSEMENVTIFRIKPQPAYVQAYAIYQSALKDLTNNQFVWAAAKLQEAIREVPDFPEALMLHASLLAVKDKSSVVAKEEWDKGLRLAPDLASKK
jgi:hypothetical protein